MQKLMRICINDYISHANFSFLNSFRYFTSKSQKYCDPTVLLLLNIVANIYSLCYYKEHLWGKILALEDKFRNFIITILEISAE